MLMLFPKTFLPMRREKTAFVAQCGGAEIAEHLAHQIGTAEPRGLP